MGVVTLFIENKEIYLKIKSVIFCHGCNLQLSCSKKIHVPLCMSPSQAKMHRDDFRLNGKLTKCIFYYYKHEFEATISLPCCNPFDAMLEIALKVRG